MVQISKIRQGRSSWTITLRELIDETTRRESKVTVGLNVDPELASAVQGLQEEALDFVGAPEEWSKECRVTGVTITWDDSELAGAVVSLAIPVDGANGPLNLATPYAEITDGNSGLPKSFVEAIERAIGAAEAVVKRVAKQQELFE